MVSVDCIRVGDCQSNRCIFTSVKNVILSFLCQYSLFLDNFFFQMKDYSQNFILTQKVHFEENGSSEGTECQARTSDNCTWEGDRKIYISFCTHAGKTGDDPSDLDYVTCLAMG